MKDIAKPGPTGKISARLRVRFAERGLVRQRPRRRRVAEDAQHRLQAAPRRARAERRRRVAQERRAGERGADVRACVR